MTARLLLLGVVLCSANVLAQTDTPMMEKTRSGQSITEPVPHDLCAQDGIALAGFDLVTYRQDDGPVVGSTEYKVNHDGLTYLFVNATNRTAFSQNPEKFLPEYSGFCAITLALGRVTCPQYTNFKIEDDRLLLFEVTGFTNGRTLWNSDPVGYRDKADKNFAKIK